MPGARQGRCRDHRRLLPALEHPNVTLLVDHEVTRLDTDAGGRTVTGVITQHGSAEEVFSADIVVVSAGATNSARLLLSSASDTHPNGLANGSDQVGRNYMFHNSKAVVALAAEPNETAFQKTLGLNDFYFGGPDFDFPLGNIQMVGKSNAEAMKGEEPHLTLLAPTGAWPMSPPTPWTSGSPPRTFPGPRIGSRSTARATCTWPTRRRTTRRRTASTAS